MKACFLKFLSILALLTVSQAANAQLLDLLKGRNELKSQLYVYDVRGKIEAAAMKEIVFNALTEQSASAMVKDNLVTGEAPKYPGRISFKEMSFMAVVVQIPKCEGASFTVSSSDNSMASWGDSAQYMACGFRYGGGWRVNLYLSTQSSGGGVAGILSGKTFGKVIAGAIGLSADPEKFIESSVDKLEQQLKDQNIQYALVEAAPGNAKRIVAEDPLLKGKVAAEQRAADRGKRMAARTDLQKLGIDASDRSRFIRAIQSGDEDVVTLFIEAAAVDLTQSDSTGRKPIDYATKPAIKDLLQSL